MPAKKRTVRVAMIKAEAGWAAPQENLELLERLALPLAKRGIDVLITPECFLDGYMVRDQKNCTRRKLLARCVRGPSDPAIRRVARLARKLQCNVVFGASERDEAGTIRNAAFLLDRSGGHVGTYYKVQSGEQYLDGDALPVFETDLGVVGIVICADRRWPEVIRCLRIKGARIILNPTWGFKGDLNEAIIRTRAYENGIPVCFTHPHQSLICLRNGSVGAVLESGEPGVLVHDVEIGDPVSFKLPGEGDNHPACVRRPGTYSALVE